MCLKCYCHGVCVFYRCCCPEQRLQRCDARWIVQLPWSAACRAGPRNELALCGSSVEAKDAVVLLVRHQEGASLQLLRRTDKHRASNK